MINGPTVFLVDHDTEAREATKKLIESAGLPVKTYGSGAAFLESVDYESPGCVVVDVCLLDMNGLQLLDKLVTSGCDIPVILVTGFADIPMCVQAFKSGALAFLEKPVDQQLLEKIHLAIEKDRCRREKAAATSKLLASIASLTPRQREVMDLILAGNTICQIGFKCECSLPTVSKHRTRVLSKLKVKNDVLLVRRLLNQ